MDLLKQIQHMEKIGVKVWVYNGEVLPTKKVEKEEANA